VLLRRSNRYRVLRRRRRGAGVLSIGAPRDAFVEVRSSVSAVGGGDGHG
jgi:hypothetical protein